MPEEHESLIRAEIRHLREAVTSLNQTVKDLGAELRKEYLRRELYESEKRDLEKDILAVDKRVTSHDKSRAWVIMIIIGGFLSSLLAIVFTTGALR